MGCKREIGLGNYNLVCEGRNETPVVYSCMWTVKVPVDWALNCIVRNVLLFPVTLFWLIYGSEGDKC